MAQRLLSYGLDPIMGDTRLEDVMVEHVFKRHVTLQPVVVAKTLKSPEQRMLGTGLALLTDGFDVTGSDTKEDAWGL
jgi:hypothetical protein